MCELCVNKGLMSQEELAAARAERDLSSLPFIEMSVTEAMDTLDQMIEHDTRIGVPLEITQVKWSAVQDGYFIVHPDRVTEWQNEMVRRIQTRVATMTPDQRALLGEDAQQILATMNMN